MFLWNRTLGLAGGFKMSRMVKTRIKLASDLRIPFYQLGSGKGGPKVLVFATLHGGENTTAQIAYGLISVLEKNPRYLRGEVGVIPIVNKIGFLKQTRENPTDGKNINGAGTGVGKVTQSDEVALRLINLCQRYDYALDIHSGSLGRYLSHVFVTKEEDAELARSFGASLVVLEAGSVSNSKDYTGNSGNVKEAIIARASKKGCTGFGLEIGGGVCVEKKDVEEGLSSVLSFLHGIDLVKLRGLKRKKPTKKSQIFLKKRNLISERVVASVPGNIFYRVKLGEVVKKGRLLAEIFDPGKLEITKDIRSPVEGRVVYKFLPSRVEPKNVEARSLLIRLVPKDNRHA